jgi:hypothetical protein
MEREKAVADGFDVVIVQTSASVWGVYLASDRTCLGFVVARGDGFEVVEAEPPHRAIRTAALDDAVTLVLEKTVPAPVARQEA